MASYLFRLADIGEGIAEAEIQAWHVKPGDLVREDQTLVDVMTDKATVDISSPVDGKVIAIHGAVGEMAPVGSVLVEFEVADAAKAAEPPPVAAPAPLAAPATRHRAKEMGVSLETVKGSGPEGRITPADLASHIAASKTPAARESVTEIPIVGLRRKIAEKMQDAVRRIPHITYVEECDLTELEALRADLNDNRKPEQPKLTLLPFLIRAMVRVLPEFPQINARYDDEAGVLQQFSAAHVGIATQTASGLMVPVLRHAETRDIWNIAAEIARLSAAARDGGASRDELSGSTITITSLGPLGGIATTPIINHPEVAIVGPNKIVERPVVNGGFISVRKCMNISSSFDHRIVDGHDAARFIQQVKRLLEHPALIFMM